MNFEVPKGILEVIASIHQYLRHLEGDFMEASNRTYIEQENLNQSKNFNYFMIKYAYC